MNDEIIQAPKRLGELFKNPYATLGNKPKSKDTERGELLKYFQGRVNTERVGTKYKQVSIAFIATKVAGLTLRDLYYIKSSCDDSNKNGYSWSKCFFGSLKPRDEKAK